MLLFLVPSRWRQAGVKGGGPLSVRFSVLRFAQKNRFCDANPVRHAWRLGLHYTEKITFGLEARRQLFFVVEGECLCVSCARACSGKSIFCFRLLSADRTDQERHQRLLQLL